MARRSTRGWGVSTAEFQLLVDQFRDVPRELKSGIRKAVAQAAQGFISDVKASAAWSSRIPSAVRVKTSFAQKNPGVRVYVDSKKAPHARPYEGLTSGGLRFRHPVFGNRDVWVNQDARPFFQPNVEKHRAKVLDAIETALIQTLPRR